MYSAHEGTPLMDGAHASVCNNNNNNKVGTSTTDHVTSTTDHVTGYSKSILSKNSLGRGSEGGKTGSSSSSANNSSSSSANNSSNAYYKRDSSGYPSLSTTFSNDIEPVTRGRLLIFFNLVSLFTCIVGALISFFQTITLLLVYHLAFQDTMCIILVIYQVIFGIIIVLVEMVNRLYIYNFSFLFATIFFCLLSHCNKSYFDAT